MTPHSVTIPSGAGTTTTANGGTTKTVHDDPEELDQWYRLTLLGPNDEFAEGYVERPSKSAVRPKSSVAMREIPCPYELVSDIVGDYDQLANFGWDAVVSDDHAGGVRRPAKGDRDHVVAGPIRDADEDSETITIGDGT